MKKELFTERIEIRMTPEHYRIVKQVAKERNTTISEAIRICISEYTRR